jgi:hypothetical protein
MASVENFRKSARYAHKATVIVTDEARDFFSYARLSNFSSGGLYLESDYAFPAGARLRVQFDSPGVGSAPKSLNSVVTWCRRLRGADADYSYGVGVKFL